ncbi:DeoR/GlpR family DNA-binding transcription regulator [Pseudactinotalea sp. Z1748]|uniref:DeoR/GlpR family DNA-binding transcription regulator n=1 Tax=Pseudactinotalea sp. Z1748 TaxID=3413027 RepID=UPI003C7A5E21
MTEPTTARSLPGAERRARIMELLSVHGFQKVTDLVDLLGVSDMTVRRDLRKLAAARELRVVHGGASLLHATLRTPDFTSRGAHQRAAKQRMAQAALGLIKPGATIAFDAGTTAFELAAALPPTFSGCVISHSVPVLQHMLNFPHLRVIGLGGELLVDSQAFVGGQTVAALANLHADVLFIGVAALRRSGMYVATDQERPTKQALMQAAGRVVLLADHSKFDAAAPVLLGELDQVDVLVTDRPLQPPLSQAFAEARVQVLTAT